MVTKKLTPLQLQQVNIQGGFWGPRLESVRTHTIPHLFQFLQSEGFLDAWKLDWKEGQPKKPHIFWDSDTAKTFEAAAYSLVSHPDKALEAKVDSVVEMMERAQAPDGYLNSHFLSVAPGKRLTNLRDNHELYCAGHLVEAAVAYYQATGKRKFLDILCRYVDHIATVFGPREGQIHGYPGHEEIELALVKLYRVTGETRFLDLAKYFIDERGKQPYYFDVEEQARGEEPRRFNTDFLKFQYDTFRYYQAHQPVREQSEAVGHSVRALYLYSAMVDVTAETGDQSLLDACHRLWQSVTERRMYLTGGVGSAGAIEGFSSDYDLPNDSAYAETCASIALALWAHRLLQVEPDGKYADVLERALYNGILSGIALDGEHFFYPNPLAFYPESLPINQAERHGIRQAWFECACCPTNIARFLAGLGQFIYANNQDELYVHLYVQSQADLTLAGKEVSIKQTTDYPWDEKVEFTVSPETPVNFTLALRIPAWCREASLSVNNKKLQFFNTAGYARITRSWQAGDKVTLTLAMPVERVEAHPEVRGNIGRAALQRGPVVYCLEQADNGAGLDTLRLPQETALSSEFDPGLLGGAVVITGQGLHLDSSAWVGDALYRTGNTAPETSVKIRAVPYALWANRNPGEMIVWIRK